MDNKTTRKSVLLYTASNNLYVVVSFETTLFTDSEDL